MPALVYRDKKETYKLNITKIAKRVRKFNFIILNVLDFQVFLQKLTGNILRIQVHTLRFT